MSIYNGNTLNENLGGEDYQRKLNKSNTGLVMIVSKPQTMNLKRYINKKMIAE